MTLSATTHEQIEVEIADGVARITLNRPDALNPLSVKMAGEIHSVIDEIAADPETRAVLILSLIHI